MPSFERSREGGAFQRLPHAAGERRSHPHPERPHLEGGGLDIDGDGRRSVIERFTTPREPRADAGDYGDLADRIDLRIAESADWPALNSALRRAAEAGYDVARRLPVIAAAEPLPNKHPATELRYRLMADCGSALAVAATHHTPQSPANPEAAVQYRPAPASREAPLGRLAAALARDLHRSTRGCPDGRPERQHQRTPSDATTRQGRPS
jgi:hypothetical protein